MSVMIVLGTDRTLLLLRRRRRVLRAHLLRCHLAAGHEQRLERSSILLVLPLLRCRIGLGMEGRVGWSLLTGCRRAIMFLSIAERDGVANLRRERRQRT